jgi:hypothetical protein
MIKEFKLTINGSCNFTSNACQDFAGLGLYLKLNIYKEFKFINVKIFLRLNVFGQFLPVSL